MNLKLKLYDEILKRSLSIPFKVLYWNGEERLFGGDEPRATIIFNKPLEWKKVSTDATLAFAEAYINKDIEVEGSLQEVLASAFSRKESFLESRKFKFVNILQKHDKKNSKTDVRAHYDIGNDFYKYWLDKTMTYSCAYFKTREEGLEEAQENKINHILSKLRLQEGDELLDIGCGWGNLIITAAKKYNIKAVGCTLSKEQFIEVERKIKEEKLENKVEVLLMDYRDLSKLGRKFNKISSVGMFEHVGKENIPEYIHCINKLMTKNALALIHGISGQRDIDDETYGKNSFINKYIFPGGYIPSIAEMIIPANKEKLKIIDVESLRIHYQLTLEHWHKRFMQHWDEIEKQKGERFMRIWDIYLQSCAAVFEAGELDVCQYLYEKGVDNTRPLTRVYMG